VDSGHIINRENVLKNHENVRGRSIDVKVIQRSVSTGSGVAISLVPSYISSFIICGVDSSALLSVEKSDAPSGTRT